MATQSSLVLPGSAQTALDPRGALSAEQRATVLRLAGLEQLDLTRSCAQLSAGQLQLVSFARALARALYDPACRG